MQFEIGWKAVRKEMCTVITIVEDITTQLSWSGSMWRIDYDLQIIKHKQLTWLKWGKSTGQVQ